MIPEQIVQKATRDMVTAFLEAMPERANTYNNFKLVIDYLDLYVGEFVELTIKEREGVLSK